MTSESNVRRAVEVSVSAVLGTVTRRQFLQALVAAGAAVALPGPVEEASAEAIDGAWQRAVEQPWCFDVNEWGTIVEPGVKEPRVWSDLYSVSDVSPRDPEHLIGQIEDIYPLQRELQVDAEYASEQLTFELEALADDPSRRAEIEQLIEDLEDPERGWAAWIRQQGTDGLEEVGDRVQQWLTEQVDWAQSDYFPADWHGIGRAYQFFLTMDTEVLDALGVEIVEGDHPGSDYFAAELRAPIEEANAQAAALGLPFRFRSEEVRS